MHFTIGTAFSGQSSGSFLTVTHFTDYIPKAQSTVLHAQDNLKLNAASSALNARV
jgi:hypothetical protein